MAIFSALLSGIQALQLEVLRAAPYRDIGLVPNPGASASAIAAVEQRISRPLPPSYREFLALHDGWPRFFEGASLLGSANLGERTYDEIARATFEAAEAPAPHGAGSARAPRSAVVPFGIDPQGTTLFAFDTRVTRADGEYEVVLWVNEIGVRCESFLEFLEFVRDMCQAEVETFAAPQEGMLRSA
jgi:hypothetical protein